MIVLLWAETVVTQTIHLGTQRSSHLDIPTEYQYLIDSTILIPMGGFLITIVDVDY